MGGRAVFLVGFMACGKTTAGVELAGRLGWDFVDLDAQIEAREGVTIAEIFQARGESEFRKMETSALRDLTQSLRRDTVVALGGGTFPQTANRELLGCWPSIFLDVPLDELWRRSQGDPGKRPLRKEDPQAFARLHEERLPLYRQATVTVVTSGRSAVSICDEIERILNLRATTETVRSSQIFPGRFETGESK